MRRDIRSWLSPPDPWKNYNIARELRLSGTGAWFLRGDTLSEWKACGPKCLLWIHGKRQLLPSTSLFAENDGFPLSQRARERACFGMFTLCFLHIEKLTVRCKTHPRLKTDPTSCAVAVYHGSWGEPDTKFADAVMASVAKGDAPNFDMPKNSSMEFLDVASETSPRLENAASPESAISFDDRERGWSSALFPARRKQPVSKSIDGTGNGLGADDLQSHRVLDAHPSTTRRCVDGLFVARSPERRPQ